MTANALAKPEVDMPTNLGAKNPEGSTSIRNRPQCSWAGMLATSTFFAGAATVLLHLMGVVIHRTYLAAWGVSSNQFPKSTDWLLTNGYYGIWNGVALLFSTMLESPIATICTVAFIVFYIWLFFTSWDPISYLIKRMTGLQKLPHRLRQLLLWSSAVAMATVFLLCATAVLVLLWGVPAQAGRIVGNAIIEQDVKDFSKGCATSKRPCIEILKTGELLGRGYILDGSPTHLAYFDIEYHRARVVPLDGLEIQATVPPKGYTGASTR